MTQVGPGRPMGHFNFPLIWINKHLHTSLVVRWRPELNPGTGQAGGVLVDPPGKAEVGPPADAEEPHHAKGDG